VISLDLGQTPFRERLTFVWLATGAHGESEAAYVIDTFDLWAEKFAADDEAGQ